MYHVNDEGDVLPCNATVRECRYGHHDADPSEARHLYEEEMRAEELRTHTREEGEARLKAADAALLATSTIETLEKSFEHIDKGAFRYTEPGVVDALIALRSLEDDSAQLLETLSSMRRELKEGKPEGRAKEILEAFAASAEAALEANDAKEANHRAYLAEQDVDPHPAVRLGLEVARARNERAYYTKLIEARQVPPAGDRVGRAFDTLSEESLKARVDVYREDARHARTAGELQEARNMTQTALQALARKKVVY